MNFSAAIGLLCCPPLPEPVRAALQRGDGAPFTFIDSDAGSLDARIDEPDVDLAILDLYPADDDGDWAVLVARKPVVLRVDRQARTQVEAAGPMAQHWHAAIEGGVQDILTLDELLAPQAGLRLRAAVSRHQASVRASHAHSTDLGTGLPHRQQLLEHMNHLLALREREPAPMAALVLGVDGIATTLQRLGADSAAVLRRKLAVRLRSCLRASDVVAALEGENFAVLLSWVDNPANVDGVVAKLLAAARRPFMLSGQPIGLSVSIGIARYPEDGADAAGLLHKALSQATHQMKQGDLFARPLQTGAPAANDEDA